ncbi:hypothetical protein JOF56_006939 [Kibdelosporangium banguiense]|uniref:DUF4241 domain-containing protein n=1 Tax=Kibdelosporangium banguiense TaxID=1365924 RepID=A0ABS4TQ69_9PSEU|nr:DUF4241 domain-containing protein [Kibdelosporangium banguiense]MBP2326554.1 hypothetical protein [Kibdelosporangium banguiense]
MVVLVVAFGLGMWRWIRSQETPATPGQQAQQDKSRKLRRDGFERLFQPGATVRFGITDSPVQIRDLGDLDMPSGRLMACDPVLQADNPEIEQPFTVTVPPGRYPVSVSVVQRDVDGQTVERVAAARMTVRPDPVVRWEMALQPTDDTSLLTGEKYYGFGVDTGLAAFLDADMKQALSRLGAENGPIEKTLLGDDPNEARAAEVRDPVTGRNVMAFHAGLGDGSYPTWIGRTADNRPAMFVIDFQFADW